MKSDIESWSDDKFRSEIEIYVDRLKNQDERIRLVDQEELKSATDKILKLLDQGNSDLAKVYFSGLQERYKEVEEEAGKLKTAVEHLKKYLKIIDAENI